MNLSKKINLLAAVLVLIALTLTVVGVVLRIINLSSFYDARLDYYEKDALPFIMNLTFVFATAFFAASCFVVERKKSELNFFQIPLFFKICCAVCAVAMLLASVRCFTEKAQPKVMLALALLAILSAGYFLLFFFRKLTDASALLALAPTAMSVVMLGITYFDVKTTMNSPNKLLLQFACIACMLGFLADARVIADIKHRKTYFFFITSALFFSGVSSIPSVILYFSNSFNYAYLKFDCIMLAFFIYFAARALALCLIPECDSAESQ